MGGLQKVSFDKDQLREIKRRLTNDKPYADRMSLGFAARLLSVRACLNEDLLILAELDNLEGLGERSKAPKERQFRYSPLHPFWHTHWSAPRHILRNIGIYWNLIRAGKRDRLTPMLHEVARKHGDDPDRWQRAVPYRTVIDGYRGRAKRGLTGDWIIFGKHAGQNYYLDLATHEEGSVTNANRLYQKLRQGSAAEFPFLFDKLGS